MPAPCGVEVLWGRLTQGAWVRVVKAARNATFGRKSGDSGSPQSCRTAFGLTTVTAAAHRNCGHHPMSGRVLLVPAGAEPQNRLVHVGRTHGGDGSAGRPATRAKSSQWAARRRRDPPGPVGGAATPCAPPGNLGRAAPSCSTPGPEGGGTEGRPPRRKVGGNGKISGRGRLPRWRVPGGCGGKGRAVPDGRDRATGPG